MRGGEIDLIARHGSTIVFIEVRSRSGQGFGGAAVSVDARKRRRLIHAASAWLATLGSAAAPPCRFDVIAIDSAGAQSGLDWIRDAFRLGD